MNERNNFKQLEEEEELRFGTSHDQHLRSQLWGSLSFFRFVGQLVDMFVPKVFELFITAAKGNHTQRKYPTPPSQGPQEHPGRIGPGSPDGGETPRDLIP